VAAVTDQIWANVNREGHWNDRHFHGTKTRSLVASCVYFPETPQGPTSPLRLFPAEEEEREVFPQAGLMVMFSPEVEHEVGRVPPGGNARVSVACNLAAWWLSTPLLRAAHAGQAEEARALVEAGAGVDEADPSVGFRPLHLAASAGHLPVAEALVASGADASAVSLDGWSPLGLAADRGHADIVRFLHGAGASAGATLNKPEAGIQQIGASTHQKAVLMAAERGHVSVVQLLATALGPPLAVACASGHAPVVQHLLQRRADPCDSPGGKKPLHLAASNGHADVIRLLVGADADMDARDDKGKSAAHLAVDAGHLSTLRAMTESRASVGWDIDAADKQGATPLHWAASHGRTEILAHLVEAGASTEVEASGAAPGSPLYWAAREGHAVVVDKLLEVGAGLSASGASIPMVPPEGPPAVLVRKGADVWERVHFSDVLKRRKLPADAANEAGGTPLHVAASAGHLDVAKILCRSGALASSLDRDGATPQHWAAANGHLELTEHLLGLGADPNAADSAGSPPLHDAAWSGHRDVARQLLDAGAPAGAANAAGLTALHAAAALGHGRLVQLLVEQGASPTAADAQGRSPMDLVEATLRILRTMRSAGYGQEMMARAEEVAAILGGAASRAS